jgi:RNA-directed DNA polymerase
MKLSLRQEMQESLGISEDQLKRLILRSPYAYKIYDIPKRNGGSRSIAQPAAETKFIQYWLITNIFHRLPVHACATAYMRNSGILKNASAHKDNSYLTKFDFKSFFTSIKLDDLVAHFTKHFGDIFGADEINDIARISCIKLPENRELCLSIGAPSSPALSNSIMFEFDAAVFTWCTERGITYTRYADDLTFSTNEKGLSSCVEPTLRKIIRKLEYPSLRFNTKKTTHLSKKYQRRVTGLIINNEGNVSLGRERKREISALIHKFSLKQLSAEETYRLQGLLGFARDVEPLFMSRMRGKYRSALIEEILQIRKPTE